MIVVAAVLAVAKVTFFCFILNVDSTDSAVGGFLFFSIGELFGVVCACKNAVE